VVKDYKDSPFAWAWSLGALAPLLEWCSAGELGGEAASTLQEGLEMTPPMPPRQSA
jgi:hypothetical protein